MVGGEQALEVGGLAAGVGHGGRGEPEQELVDGLGGAGGLVVEDEGGVVGVAEERGALGAQAGEASDDGAVVEFAAAGAAGERGLLEALAHGAVGEGVERRLPGGVDEAHEELAVVAGLLRGRGGGGEGGLGPAGELGAGGDEHGGGVGLLQEVLRERGLEGGELGVEGAEAFLLGGAEAGAGADEAGVRALEGAEGFGIEAERGAAGVERVDAGEERGVEEDGVSVGGELGRHLLLHGLEGGVCVGGVETAEEALDALEGEAGAFEGFDRVGEGRCGGVGGDGLDLAEAFGHGGLVGGAEVFVADEVEARVAELEGALDEQGILGGGETAGEGEPAEEGRKNAFTHAASAAGLAPGVSREMRGWWALRDSNPQPRDYESPALTVELRAHVSTWESDRRDGGRRGGVRQTQSGRRAPVAGCR